MACDTVRPRIRSFLDDLLDESDYQDTRAHLESCTTCRAYASSVGTLSYRVYELGEVPLPPDMASAVLYEAKKPVSAPTAETAPASVAAREGVFLSNKDLFWAGIVVLLALSAVSFAVTAAFQKKEERPAAVPVAPVFSPPAAPAADLGDEGEGVLVRTE